MSSSEVGERSLIEAIPTAVLVLETGSWLVRETNSAAETLLGTQSESVVGTSIDALHSGDEDALLSDVLDVMAEEGGTQSRRELGDGSQISVRTGAGSAIPVEVRTRRHTTDDDCLVIVLRDISEQLQDARGHRIAERVLEHAFDAMYVTDEYGEIRRVNEAFEETTGYTAENVRNLGIGILEPGEGALVDRYAEREETDTWTEERTFERTTGEQYVGQQTVAPIPGHGTELDGFVVVHRDVTEARLRSQQLDVFHRVLRHDLRNAVTVIQGQSEVLLRRCPDSSHLDRLQTIQDRATALMETSRKARDARETVSVDGGRTGGKDLLEFLDGLLQQMAASHPDAMVEFQRDLDEPVRVDYRASTVVRELVENAFEHAGTPAPEVSVTVEPADAGVAVTISDDGPGIAEEERQALEAKEESPLKHTSGLGLWLVNWIADTLGGSVDIEVAGHDGTTVTATLPTTSQ